MTPWVPRFADLAESNPETKGSRDPTTFSRTKTPKTEHLPGFQVLILSLSRWLVHRPTWKADKLAKELHLNHPWQYPD